MKCVLVVGSGIMGRGIAYVTATEAKLPVVLVDTSAEALDKALAYIKRIAEREGLNVDEVLSRITPCTSSKEALQMHDVDFVIEAVSEKFELKKVVFNEIVKYAKPDTALATNTSSYPITGLAESVGEGDRSRIIGMHFFNPVPRVPGLEVIPTKYTSKDIVKRTIELGTEMGKDVSLCSKDISGFLVNRLLNATMLEALNLVEQGAATPEDIDKIMRAATGSPMGPFGVLDLVGLDTASAVAHIIYDHSGDHKYEPSKLLDDMVKQGNLGMKTGKGFYEYSKL